MYPCGNSFDVWLAMTLTPPSRKWVVYMTTQESKFSLTPYKRVLQIAKRPGKNEFMQVSGITGGGALAIGLVGMIIYGMTSFNEIVALGSLTVLLALLLFIPYE